MKNTKLIFVRDAGTCMPALLVSFNPKHNRDGSLPVICRAGLHTDGPAGNGFIGISFLNANSFTIIIDVHLFLQHGTQWCALMYAQCNWDLIDDGMNLDVESYRLRSQKGDTRWLKEPPILKSPDL